MKITGVETFILHVPVTRQGIADSTHAITHWGAPGVIVRTDAGIDGYGYSGTHAHLPSDRLITSAIADTLGPQLTGRDPTEVMALWETMARFPPVQWVGRGGIVTLAVGALDVALWDIKAKAAGQPLWQLLGGTARGIAAYNTDGGWLNWPLDTLVDDCKRALEVDGFRGVKIKVGSERVATDVARTEAVRKAVGEETFLAVDANGRMDLPAAMGFGQHLDRLGINWFEEPLWYDDVASHRRLAQSMRTPIALGEQLYVTHNFASFMDAGAVHYLQPDVARIGGVTPWLEVARMAHARGFPVVSHVGDMMQTHLHLAIAHPACTMLEYIPWMRDCFTEPATAIDGTFVVPREPGAGTTLRPGIIDRYGVR